MHAYAVWRLRPVFITSTFRDMHAERDYLHNHVFQSWTPKQIALGKRWAETLRLAGVDIKRIRRNAVSLASRRQP